MAANTPAQFRKFTAVLSIEQLRDDSRALDLDAFNAPGGFVVPRDTNYVITSLRSALEHRSAFELEHQLNQVGVPAAHARRLGEFLREADETASVALPDFRFQQGAHTVRTRGFAFAQDRGASVAGAESLGESTARVLKQAGVSEDAMAALRSAGVIGTAAPLACAASPVGTGQHAPPSSDPMCRARPGPGRLDSHAAT